MSFGIFRQAEKVWETGASLHSERGGHFILYVGVLGLCPQYPHPLLLLLNH